MACPLVLHGTKYKTHRIYVTGTKHVRNQNKTWTCHCWYSVVRVKYKTFCRGWPMKGKWDASISNHSLSFNLIKASHSYRLHTKYGIMFKGIHSDAVLLCFLYNARSRCISWRSNPPTVTNSSSFLCLWGHFSSVTSWPLGSFSFPSTASDVLLWTCTGLWVLFFW